MDDESPSYLRPGALVRTYPSVLQVLAPITIGSIGKRAIHFRVARAASCGQKVHSESELFGDWDRHKGDDIKLMLGAGELMIPPILSTLRLIEVIRHLMRVKNIITYEPVSRLNWNIPSCGIPLQPGAAAVPATYLALEVFIGGEFTLEVSYEFESSTKVFSKTKSGWEAEKPETVDRSAPVKLTYECMDTEWSWELDVIEFYELLRNFLRALQALAELVRKAPKVGFYMEIEQNAGAITISCTAALVEKNWRVSRSSVGTLTVTGLGGKFTGGWGIKSHNLVAGVEFSAGFELVGKTDLWRVNANGPWIGGIATTIEVKFAGVGELNFYVVSVKASIGCTWGVELGYGVHEKMPDDSHPVLYLAGDDVKGFIEYGGGGMEGSGEEGGEKVEWTWFEAPERPFVVVDFAAG